MSERQGSYAGNAKNSCPPFPQIELKLEGLIEGFELRLASLHQRAREIDEVIYSTDTRLEAFFKTPIHAASQPGPGPSRGLCLFHLRYPIAPGHGPTYGPRRPYTRCLAASSPDRSRDPYERQACISGLSCRNNRPQPACFCSPQTRASIGLRLRKVVYFSNVPPPLHRMRTTIYAYRNYGTAILPSPTTQKKTSSPPKSATPWHPCGHLLTPHKRP